MFVTSDLSIYLVSDQELGRFNQFVRTRPQFDVVVDGLNVANIHKGNSKRSETVGRVPLWSHWFDGLSGF